MTDIHFNVLTINDLQLPYILAKQLIITSRFTTTAFIYFESKTPPHMPYRLYDTSSNDTSSTEPFRRKGFLSKCHFVECPLRRNRVSSNTFDEIFNAHLAAILCLLIL